MVWNTTLGRFAGILVSAVLVATMLVVGAIATINYSGFTPGQLLDYADRRLDGHPKLITVLAPALLGLRHLTGDKPLETRRAEAFEVAPPPPRSNVTSQSVPE